MTEEKKPNNSTEQPPVQEDQPEDSSQESPQQLGTRSGDYYDLPCTD
jgi:hypothetical protein